MFSDVTFNSKDFKVAMNFCSWQPWPFPVTHTPERKKRKKDSSSICATCIGKSLKNTTKLQINSGNGKVVIILKNNVTKAIPMLSLLRLISFHQSNRLSVHVVHQVITMSNQYRQMVSNLFGSSFGLIDGYNIANIIRQKNYADI